ncbi:hypothetical protein ACHAXT_007112 [Thalassiosira profunda]
MTKMAACNLRASARSAAAHQRGAFRCSSADALRRTIACNPLALSANCNLLSQGARSQICIRSHTSKPSGASSSTFRERIGEWRRNGTPEIAVGATILALVGIDYILQTRNDEQRGDMYRQLEREVRRDEATSRREDKKLLDGGAAARAKFQCVVRKVPQNFDGHKCLKNVKVGDVVGVIEEGVGPDGMYNLCSIERGSAKNAGKESAGDEGGKRTSIGWFPCSCLQKIE